MKRQINAFTLAEVLITLGIIGVVAALTLPTLIKKYEAKALETQFEKAYSVLSQSNRMMLAQGTFPMKSLYYVQIPLKSRMFQILHQGGIAET